MTLPDPGLLQATRTTKEDFLQLLKTLNKALGPSAMSDQHVEQILTVFWPQIQDALDNLPPPGTTARPHRRREREMLAELGELSRSTNAQNTELLVKLNDRVSALELSRAPTAGVTRIPGPDLVVVDSETNLPTYIDFKDLSTQRWWLVPKNVNKTAHKRAGVKTAEKTDPKKE